LCLVVASSNWCGVLAQVEVATGKTIVIIFHPFPVLIPIPAKISLQFLPVPYNTWQTPVQHLLLHESFDPWSMTFCLISEGCECSNQTSEEYFLLQPTAKLAHIIGTSWPAQACEPGRTCNGLFHSIRSLQSSFWNQ